MDSMKEFHLGVGELIMACQCIERDIKIIYASMLKGDFYQNYRLVERAALGQTLVYLQELDCSDGKPYFSAGDYALLGDIRKIRNHWAHEAYARFVYKRGKEQLRAWEKEYRRLLIEKEKLQVLQKQTEKIRFDILQKYDRI